MPKINLIKNRKPEILISILGLGIIILSLILRSIFPTEVPWMPEGFTTPIIAFEFLLTTSEVLMFFGSAGPEQEALVEAMLTGHKIDNVYLVVYGLFLAGWSLLAARKTRNNFFYLLIFFAILASIGDWYENKQLVLIASNLSWGYFDGTLFELWLCTWLKWGSLSITLAGLSFFTWKQGWTGKIFAVVSAITLILGGIAFFERSAITSYFTLGITLGFVLLIIKSFVLLLRKADSIEQA
ncbi:MAG: hypothetical protein DWQ02_12685 [Bacteroidetes bacterium]|nr:MAG: hypothetical protein DWQ02_12685 [Bacteroidota bacterium]